MKMNDAKQIAQTIIEQIGMRNFMCFGCPRGKLIALPETDKMLGGLQFSFTNCRKIRSGKVQVILKPDDTYDVKIFNRLGNCVYSGTDIYCENLFEILDDKIGS